ncbi:hypothetical protein FHETE_6898 [Fusarium heterosporum]|uniref:Uncharacterized protein n=1 Tax=Fusarium heterosporum TaxID=42747 RepID=A0A8H5T3D4_FUSHE|nr:hypothetical protein FHETE_6898 [Fusarium heterosporum]
MGKLTDLSIFASKLNLNNTETNPNDPGDISRYQAHPFARFNPDENQPDVMDKNSREYRERIAKIIDVLEQNIRIVCIHYKDLKTRYIAAQELWEQQDWNVFVLDPARKRENLEHLNMSGFDRIEFHDHSMKGNDLTAWDACFCELKTELRVMESLLAAGRREQARLEGSDSFIQMRNEWAKNQNAYVDKQSVSSCDLDRTLCSSCVDSNLIYD